MSSQSIGSAYLDHAATTPMRPEAIAALTEELAWLGNPSSLHAAGRRARRVVEESREQLAEVFGARPSEVVFTSGGTEADNLAVKGLYWARRDGVRRRVLTTSVEHHAILDSVRWLEEAQGAEAVWLAVGADGIVRPDALRAAIAQAPEQVAVASVMWANNEVGTVQPVAELAAVAHEYGIPFHTDAVQAAAQLPVDFAASGADALTVSGHKLGGPVGVGALILARGAEPVPVLHGGGQERDIRSGTLDTPAIRAFAVAAEVCAQNLDDEAKRLTALRDDLVRQVLAIVPDAGDASAFSSRPVQGGWGGLDLEHDPKSGQVRQRPLGAVERANLFARLRFAHHDAAVIQFIEIVCVQRMAQLEHHVVRDVHHVVDRILPYRFKPLPKPVRRRLHLHAAHHPSRKSPAQFRRFDIHSRSICSFLGSLFQLRLNRLQLQAINRSYFARDSVMPQAIRPIRSNLRIEHRSGRPFLHRINRNAAQGKPCAQFGRARLRVNKFL